MENKIFMLISAALVLVLIPLFIFFSNDSGKNGNKDQGENGQEQNENNENKDEKEKANPNDIIWGVDSASFTTEELYACVAEEFGKPSVWGRYLGENEDVSAGLTADEVKYLHSYDVKILLIYNHFSDATGYDNGTKQAEEAIALAKDLNVPEGKAIFADIEPSYPVDAQFIKGWFEGINKSTYIPGIYGVFSDEQELYNVYNEAAKENEDLKKTTILWTAYPQHKITSQDNAPNYEPFAPKGANILGWQYGLDAESCNIDTNLFKGGIIEYLW